MSGAEAIAVLGVISSIVSIVDGTKKVFEAAKDTKGLPEAFREVAGRLPIVESILGSAKQNIEEKGVNNDPRKGVENIVKACKEKAEKLQEVFNKVIPGEGASRVERYRKAANVPGKGHKVEKLMQGILEDVNLLAGEKGINSASKAQQEQILKAIRDIGAVAPSVPEQEFQQTDFTNSNYGSGTQYNAQGNAQQYNTAGGSMYNSAGGSMSFVIQNDKHTQNISSLRQSENEVKCLKAVFLTDPGDDRAELKDRKGSIVEGTCQWIKSHARYKSWLGSQSQLLWLSGGPGKGKTMLSIFLAEKLEETAISQNKLFLQYFCDNKENKRNTAVAVLRGLIWQLLESRRKLFDHILPSFRTQGESLFSFEPLWRIFKSMVCDPTLENTYCVLDGVDECDKASLELLLRRFAALFSADTVGPSAYHLNLLIVSRDLPDCIPKLLSSFPCISLDSDADKETSQDIELFIKTKVKELSKDENYSEALRAHVERVFRERAQGTFLWIGIVAKALREKKKIEVEEALEKFPPGLDELYARILLQIDSGRREIAAKILRWVVMAVRPLTLSELSLAIEPTLDTLIVANRDETIRDQISYCGNFLSIEEDQKGQEYEAYVEGSMRGVRVGLIHQSAKDYLLRKTQDSNLVLEDFRVKEDVANHEIAKRCLDYLQSGALENTKPYILRDKEHLKCFPMLSYAVLHWHEHARPLARSADILDLSHPFWKKKSEVRTSWLKAYWPSRPVDTYGHFAPPASFPLLHFASFLGILPLAKKLVLGNGWIDSVKRISFLNKIDSHSMTALMWAVKRGQDAVVRLLLEKGAGTEIKNKFQETALMIAVERGHETIVQSLLEKGAGVNAKNEDGETALMIAAVRGWETAMQLLLEKEANIDATNKRGETALMKAAQQGESEAAVQLLLKKGAIIEVKNESGETALMKAVQQVKSKTAMQPLLEEEADFDAKYERREQALMEIPKREGAVIRMSVKRMSQNMNDDEIQREAIVQLLLEKGANINAENQDGETTLMIATSCLLQRPRETIVWLLLEKGANIDAKNKWGRTALTLVVRHGDDNIVQFLIESGANVNAKENDGRTALINTIEYNRSKDWREAIVRLLSKHGADTEAISEDGETALAVAAYWGYEDVVRLLLESGANVNAKYKSGRTALLDTVTYKPLGYGQEAIVRLLLEYGADTDTVNEDGETALVIVLYRGYKDVVRLLLENGANLNAEDITGQTALMDTPRYKPFGYEYWREAMVRLLLEYGADTMNRDGETALAIAVGEREKAEDGRLMSSLSRLYPERRAKHLLEAEKSRLDSVIEVLSLHSQK